jgi:hypothetical protein
LIELLYAFLLAVEVKDASAKARVALLSGKVALWFLLTWFMLFCPTPPDISISSSLLRLSRQKINKEAHK